MNRTKLQSLLYEELELLIQSVTVLKYSFENCLNIGIKTDYTMAELSEFESLCSRFARSSDLLT